MNFPTNSYLGKLAISEPVLDFFEKKKRLSFTVISVIFKLVYLLITTY